jgi:hypothetical protein
VIPPVAHFVWLGRELPWAYALAIISAARRGGFARVVVHHTDVPDGGTGWRDAAREPRVELARLDPTACLRRVAGLGDRLLDVYRSLSAPAARSNVLRAAILHEQGGVYLDTDTITLARLCPLREASAFCGLEHVVLPRAVRASRSPRVWAGVAVRSAVREVLRRVPAGYRVFAKVSDRFALAANNAVLGAEPGHPLVQALLRGMVATPRELWHVRFALGTHLLQATIDAHREAIVLHPPDVFYPLAPEISAHWFRLRSQSDLGEVVSPATRVIHWYASVRTRAIVPRIDATYVREHRARQLFSTAAVLGLGREDPRPATARTSR